MIAIVDYDMGNVASVANMLKRIGAAAPVLTRDPAVLAKAERIILPGVGAFDKGMRNLSDFGLREALDDAALVRRVPILGICLGMQLLTESSEEGSAPGLGWIKGTTVRFRFPPESDLKVPHMGWNYVAATRANPLIRSDERTRFYFVHGYYVKCTDESEVLGTARYGGDFACAVSRRNIFGVQFHPEKSHRFGMELLQGFLRI